MHRSIIFNRLNEGLNRKLILISAPAGIGKSTAVSDWIHQCKTTAVWFSIDANDNDPADFLSYIISGMQSLNEGIGQRAFKLLKSPNQPNPESIINLLLVLDDFHLIS